MYRLIAQVAISILAHLFAVKLSVFHIVWVTHLEHVLQVAVEMHVHLHAVYVLNCKIIAVGWRVDNRASYLLSYETLGGSDVGLLISSVDAVGVYLRIATFESSIFLCHPIIVSKCLQVCFSSTLVWNSSATSASVACSCHAQPRKLAACFLLRRLVKVLHLHLPLSRLTTRSFEILLARWMSENILLNLRWCVNVGRI